MSRVALVAALVIVVGLAAALAGCATMSYEPRQAPLPKTPAEAHAEIDALERRIAEAKRSIGLPGEPAGLAPDAGAPSRRSAPAGGAAPLDDESPPPPSPPPAPSSTAPSPERPAPAEEAPAIEAEEKPRMRRPARRRSEEVGVAESATGRRSTRCRRVDQAADEICHAANRICAIAADLADEDARARCRRAGDDCVQARGSAAECHP